MRHYVYVLYSSIHERTYTGMTSNVSKRLQQHNEGKNRSTKAYRPWILLYVETFFTREEARLREKYLKTGIGREFVKSLLNSPSQ